MLPETAYEYRRCIARVVGSEELPWLGQDTIDRFKQLDVKLAEHGIHPHKYVRISVSLWEEWANERKLAIVPVNVLCGDVALRRYMDIGVITDTEERRAWLLHYECFAAEATVRWLVEGQPMHWVQEQLTHWYPTWWLDALCNFPEEMEEIRQEAAAYAARMHKVQFLYPSGKYPDYEDIAMEVVAMWKEWEVHCEQH